MSRCQLQVHARSIPRNFLNSWMKCESRETKGYDSVPLWQFWVSNELRILEANGRSPWYENSSRILYKLSTCSIVNVHLSSSTTLLCTSSTAQGGGRSFKDRKPIGEVCCCDAWIAEPTHWWTEMRLKLWVSRSIYMPLKGKLECGFGFAWWWPVGPLLTAVAFYNWRIAFKYAATQLDMQPHS